MTAFSPPFLDSLRQSHDPTTWPGLLVDPAVQQALRSRLDLLAPAVRGPIEALLGSTETTDLRMARALLWSAGLLVEQGAKAVSIADGVLLGSDLGTEFQVVPLLFDNDGQDAGPPERLSRLHEVLEGAFAGRPFALRVRRPLAATADFEAVSRAVQLWVMAVDRGEWRGRHAVYDDDRVAIELTLLGSRRRAPGQALTFSVGPSQGLERLSVVDSRLQTVSRARSADERPWIGVLVGRPSWGISRGYLGQLLYGTPDLVVTDKNGVHSDYRACYDAERYSLLADSSFRRLAALWWLEPIEGTALGLRGMAHENPWALGEAPAFPGTRFRALQPEERGDLGTVVMTWEGYEPTTWQEGPCTPT